MPVPEFTVRANLWNAQTKVAEVKQYRHTVIFPDREGEATQLTFCNNCGECFTRNGHCAECGYPAASAPKEEPAS